MESSFYLCRLVNVQGVEPCRLGLFWEWKEILTKRSSTRALMYVRCFLQSVWVCLILAAFYERHLLRVYRSSFVLYSLKCYHAIAAFRGKINLTCYATVTDMKWRNFSLLLSLLYFQYRLLKYKECWERERERERGGGEMLVGFVLKHVNLLLIIQCQMLLIYIYIYIL